MNATIKLGVGLYLFFLLSDCFGQCTNMLVNRNLNNFNFSVLVHILETKSDVHFYYYPDSIPDILVTINQDSSVLLDVLQNQFRKYGIHVTCDDRNNYYVVKGSPIICEIPGSVYKKIPEYETQVIYKEETKDYIDTKEEYINDTLVIGSINSENPYRKAVFSGTVRDYKSGEPVIGATVYIEELKTGVVTGNKGSFQISVPRGEYTLVVSSLDKIPHKYDLYIHSSGSSVLYVEPKLIALDEVIISAQKYDRVKSTSMGIERLTALEIKEIPVVLGERDVLKVALMLPGIQKAGEATNGFNVRGSPADQNIFYLDNIPVYNVNHLAGFFSAIHPEAMSGFSIYKSNIPVQYGGRLSSIFDIETKKGSREKFGMHGGISPISANILIDNPLPGKKGSILIGGRSTYSNWLLNQVRNPEIRNSDAYFGDLLSTIEYEPNNSNQFELVGYYSHDHINYNHLVEHTYSNKGIALKWKHLIRDKHNFESSLVFSQYDFDESNHEIVYDLFRHSYYIRHYQWKNTFVLRPHPKHTIITGIDNTFYSQSRGKHYLLQENRVIASNDLGTEQALETGLFLGDEWNISAKISAYAGLRYNLYNYLGPQDIYRYNSDEFQIDNIIDTTHYGKFSIIKTYQKPDIRFAFKYLVHPLLSIKVSYNQLQQDIVMLSNTLSIAPTDKWKLADYYLKPLTGSQYSLGFYFNSSARRWEFAAEGYYKQVSNLVEYKDGANLLITEIPETELLQGNLQVYGLEFMLERNYGKLTGWLNYTYTKTRVQVESTNPLNQVNNGLPFPANYDKPHSVNLVSNYRLTKRFSLAWNIVYSTGRPYTSPVSVYYLDGNPVINYSLRNEIRMPDYFRIDFSVNLEGNLLKKKFAHGSWMFSVYNLTGRKNAYSVYFLENDGKIEGYKLSIFGAPIYTVTYIFKLGNYND
jgi:hypothetical protein